MYVRRIKRRRLGERKSERCRLDGVSDRPSLCWVLKPGALRHL